MIDFARDANHTRGPQLPRLGQHLRPALGVKNHLRLAIAVAQIDEHDSALVAVRIDPAAKRDFLADVLGPQLAASMCAKQGRTPNVNLLAVALCAQTHPPTQSLPGHCIRPPPRAKVRLLPYANA